MFSACVLIACLTWLVEGSILKEEEEEEEGEGRRSSSKVLTNIEQITKIQALNLCHKQQKTNTL